LLLFEIIEIECLKFLLLLFNVILLFIELLLLLIELLLFKKFNEISLLIEKIFLLKFKFKFFLRLILNLELNKFLFSF
jgi:hypothetical protein